MIAVGLRVSVPKTARRRAKPSLIGHLLPVANGTLANGVKYAGDFKGDKYDGYGEVTFPNGTTQKGAFKSGWPEGRGVHTETDKDGTVHVYEGSFQHGKNSGPMKETTTAPNGIGIIQQATWVDGMREGAAVTTVYDPTGQIDQFEAIFLHDHLESTGDSVQLAQGNQDGSAESPASTSNVLGIAAGAYVGIKTGNADLARAVAVVGGASDEDADAVAQGGIAQRQSSRANKAQEAQRLRDFQQAQSEAASQRHAQLQAELEAAVKSREQGQDRAKQQAQAQAQRTNVTVAMNRTQTAVSGNTQPSAGGYNFQTALPVDKCIVQGSQPGSLKNICDKPLVLGYCHVHSGGEAIGDSRCRKQNSMYSRNGINYLTSDWHLNPGDEGPVNFRPGDESTFVACELPYIIPIMDIARKVSYCVKP